MEREDNIIAGTKYGGWLTAQTNRERYGEDYYQRLGALGGSRSTTGGFYQDPVRASKWGKLGGQRGRRGWRFLFADDKGWHYQKLGTHELRIIQPGESLMDPEAAQAAGQAGMTPYTSRKVNLEKQTNDLPFDFESLTEDPARTRHPERHSLYRLRDRHNVRNTRGLALLARDSHLSRLLGKVRRLVYKRRK